LGKILDGNTDIGQNPIHTYNTTGTYIVTLIVSNGVCKDTAVSTVLVINTTGIEQLKVSELALEAHPNPFNELTTISFVSPVSDYVILKVYNYLGTHVATLYDDFAIEQKIYTVQFNSSNLAAGTYFYALQTSTDQKIKKMVLVK